MKTTILYFLSTAMIFAHTGHGFVNNGLVHYLTSALHAVPYLLVALAAAMIFRKKNTSTSSVTSKIKIKKVEK